MKNWQKVTLGAVFSLIIGVLVGYHISPREGVYESKYKFSEGNLTGFITGVRDLPAETGYTRLTISIEVSDLEDGKLDDSDIELIEGGFLFIRTYMGNIYMSEFEMKYMYEQFVGTVDILNSENPMFIMFAFGDTFFMANTKRYFEKEVVGS